MPKGVLHALTAALLFLFIYQANYNFIGSVQNISRTDFPNYYFAGKRLINARPVYEPIESDVKAELRTESYIAYTADTPFTILLLSPLALFDISTAAVILNSLSIVLLIIVVQLLSNELGFSDPVRYFFSAASLNTIPFQFLLHKCHMEAIVLFSVSVALIAIRKKWLWIGGLCIGLASSLKLFPLLWLAANIFADSKKVFLISLLSFILFSAVGALALGMEDTAVFVTQVIPQSKIWLGVYGNYSIHSLAAVLNWPEAVSWFGSLLVLIYAIFEYKKPGKPFRRYTIAMSAALIISPLSWINYLILLFPAVLSLAIERRQIKSAAVLSVSLFFWPEYIDAGSFYPSLLLSFWPFFVLFLLLFYYQKRINC